MTYSLEFIVNTGQFEHAKLTVSAESELDLTHQLDLSDETVQGIGQFAAAFKSQVLAGKAAALGAVEPVEATAQELIETELDGKVIEVTEHQEKPAWAVSVTPKAKDWEQPKAAPVATDDGDDW